MSKKLDKHLQKISTKKKSQVDFIEGGSYTRGLYDASLIEIFGKKMGTKISNYLIDRSLKVKKKKPAKVKKK
jgi:hypothetical protein